MRKYSTRRLEARVQNGGFPARSSLCTGELELPNSKEISSIRQHKPIGRKKYCLPVICHWSQRPPSRARLSGTLFRRPGSRLLSWKMRKGFYSRYLQQKALHRQEQAEEQRAPEVPISELFGVLLMHALWHHDVLDFSPNEARISFLLKIVKITRKLPGSCWWVLSECLGVANRRIRHYLQRYSHCLHSHDHPILLC